MKKYVLGLLIVAGMLGGLALWQSRPYIETQIENALRNAGLQNVDVTIGYIGLSGAMFNEIRFGEENPLILKNLSLNYSFADLRAGRLNDILLENIAIIAVQQEAGWLIYGLEGLKTSAPQENFNPLAFIPVTTEDINTIPFQNLSVQNSSLELRSVLGTLHIPIDLEWKKLPRAELSYISEEIKISMPNMDIYFDKPSLQAVLQDGIWSGTWRNEKTRTNNPLLPELNMSGEISLNQQRINFGGNFASDNNDYSGDFTFDYTPLSENPMQFKSNLDIEIARENENLSLPLDITWTLKDQLGIKASGGKANWQKGDLALAANQIALDIKQQDAGTFKGSWGSSNIIVTAPLQVPALSAKGTISYAQNLIDVHGEISSADKEWFVDFTALYGNKDTAKDGVRIKGATMPWHNGRISVEDIWYPFNASKPVAIRLEVERVDLDELMGMMTGDKIIAQGAVSGFISLEVEPSGEISITDASLATQEPGTIMMPPELIPADNDQVNLVKEIMEDLHFKVLNISLAPQENRDNDKDVSIKLSVEGNNPKVYDGHPVKLNINLTGNLIEFAEQNIMLLTRPEQFLRENSNDEE